MKLNQLKALLAVADAGSIQEGAKTLHLTQSALSKSLKELEREVGTELLVRSARGATLTHCGQTMIRRARLIDKEIGKMREEIDSFRGAKGSRLAIGLTAPASTSPLADAVAAFVSKRPSVDLRLIEMRGPQITEGLRNGTLDLGIVSQYSTPSADFRSQQVLSHDNILIAGSKRATRETTLEQLKDETWLAFDPVDDATCYLSTLFTEFNLPRPRKIVHCSSASLYIQLAVRLSSVTHWMDSALPSLEPYLREGRMTHLTLPHAMPKLKIFLQYPDEDLLTPSASEFTDLYERQCRRWQGKTIPSVMMTFSRA